MDNERTFCEPGREKCNVWCATRVESRVCAVGVRLLKMQALAWSLEP